MKEILYVLFDLTEYTLLGLMLAYLLKDMLSNRFSKKYRLKVSAFMGVQFVGVRMFLSYSGWIKRMIYGKEMYIADSRQSILPVAISMAVTLAAGFVWYKGSRMKMLSFVTVYYAFWELARFLFYPAAVGCIDFTAGYFNRLFWEEKKISEEAYHQMMGGIEIIWNLIVSIVTVGCLFFCIRKFREYLLSGKELYESPQENFYKNKEDALTFVPGLLGLVFASMLRTILFYYKKEVYSIIKEYPELNLMIPVLSLLCILSILLSAKMLGAIKKEHEMRLQAELYQSRVKEIEEHVRDMESVHIQIRGMKHDMKHYVADINAMLAKMVSGDENARQEICRYVDSMQNSLFDLDIKYQTGNPVTDVILGRYARIARQRKISFSSEFVYPAHLGIDVFDMSVILNNGLENAFEACENEPGERFVGLYAKQRGKMFLLTIENSFTGRLQWAEEFPKSAKTGMGHGFGLRNMKNCAEKYYGKVDVQADGNRFYVTIMIQGNCEIDDKNESLVTKDWKKFFVLPILITDDKKSEHY